MNNERTRSGAAGAADSSKQTKQWVLVGVLTLVLLGALMVPSTESEGTGTPATGPAGQLAVQPQPDDQPPPPEDPEATLSEKVLQVRQLPRADLARILAANPMTTVALASEVAASQMVQPEPPPEQQPPDEQPPAADTGDADDAAEEPTHALPPQQPKPPPVRVRAIYGSGRDATALVEQKIVRPGQPLSDGRKVLDVSDRGVQLEKTPQSGPVPNPAPPSGAEFYDFGSD